MTECLCPCCGAWLTPLTLAEFRKRTEAGYLPAAEDDHSCNCYVPQEDDQ